MTQCLPRLLQFEGSSDDFILGANSKACPIIIDSDDPVAVHIAARTFASDIQKVIGSTPSIYHGTQQIVKTAIIACTLDSALAKSIDGLGDRRRNLSGKWESFHVQVVEKPTEGIDEALVILGSDRVGTTCLRHR